MNIVLYSKLGCGYCEKAKSLIRQKGLTYNELTIGKDIMVNEFTAMYPDVKSVPLILIDGVRVGGYNNLVERFNDDNNKQFLTESN